MDGAKVSNFYFLNADCSSAPKVPRTKGKKRRRSKTLDGLVLVYRRLLFGKAEIDGRSTINNLGNLYSNRNRMKKTSELNQSLNILHYPESKFDNIKTNTKIMKKSLNVDDSIKQCTCPEIIN